MLLNLSMVSHPDIKSNTARQWHYAPRSKTGSVMASDLAAHLPEFSAFYVHRHIAMPKQYNPLIRNSANEWHYLKPVLQFRISVYAAWPESVLRRARSHRHDCYTVVIHLFESSPNYSIP